MKKGLLLINLGTPADCSIAGVRRYLREFLSDKRVIDLPALLRYILLYAFILPFRPKKSAHAYQAIWTAEGSPLLINSERLTQQVRTRLQTTHTVVLGMRYGEPSLKTALSQLATCDELTIIPLFPQYSSAATGSAIEAVLRELAPQTVFPSLRIVRDFYQEPGFIQAQAAEIKPHLATHDYVLFSYHGIPKQHLNKSGCRSICTDLCPLPVSNNTACYRAQCLHTTTLLAEALSLNSTQYSSAFQSRLGRAEWIRPYTDDVLPQLAAQGIKRLVVVCPSFVVDCLETLEEIGMRAKEQWHALGGEVFTLASCVNSSALFVDALVNLV